MRNLIRIMEDAQHPSIGRPDFQEWFKGSTVVDRHGRPRVCYHGTFFDFASFEHKDLGQGGAGNGFNHLGFWFDTDSRVPSWLAGFEDGEGPQDGGNVMPCYLNIKKPLVMDSEFLWDEDRQKIVDLSVEIKAMAEVFYSARSDERGNLRAIDGSYFDETQYHKLLKQRDDLLDDLKKNRSDGFWRLMAMLPQGINSTTQDVVQFKEQVKAEGYDGFHIKDTIADFSRRNYETSDWWIALYPNQIKSIFAKTFTQSDHIMEDERSDGIEIKHDGSGNFDAMVNGHRVGYLNINLSDRPMFGEREGTRAPIRVAVDPQWRRRGVGRRLYDAAKAILAQKGHELVPSHAISDDAFEFWKSYDPSKVKRNDRLLAFQYEDHMVDFQGEKCRVTRPGFEWFVISKPDGRTTRMPAADAFAQLGQPHLPMWAKD